MQALLVVTQLVLHIGTPYLNLLVKPLALGAEVRIGRVSGRGRCEFLVKCCERLVDGVDLLLEIVDLLLKDKLGLSEVVNDRVESLRLVCLGIHIDFASGVLGVGIRSRKNNDVVIAAGNSRDRDFLSISLGHCRAHR